MQATADTASSGAPASDQDEPDDESTYWNQGYAEAIADEGQRRAWLMRLSNTLPMLTISDAEMGTRVGWAKGCATIALCERIARIARSDLPPDKG